jgi:hypothetical protein
MRLSQDLLVAWVERSCRAQGLLVKITDQATINQVRDLLGERTAGGRAQARSASTGPDVSGSQLPQRLDPVRVQSPGSADTRLDHRVVEDSVHNGDLPGQAQRFPLGA